MKVRNGELKIYMDFLDDLKLPNKASLGRTKLKQTYAEKVEELGKDQVEIIDEYDAWKDKEKGAYHNDNTELNEAMTLLLNDNVEVDFKSPFKKDLIAALENYDEELSGVNAEVYANLYENLTEEKIGRASCRERDKRKERK